MTDLEQDPNQEASEVELSRARLRKQRRERAVGDASQAGAEPNRRKSARRAVARRAASVRERLAATHINLPTEKIHSLQGKLTSTLGQVAQQLTSETPFQPDGDAEPSPQANRRRSNVQRGENLYQARAQTQRKGKSDQPYLPKKNRRLFDARSEAVPPVMVRGGMGGMAFGRVASSRLRKQKIPKRRFDVPLSIPGAEVRLPSVPLVHLGWRAISLFMVVMCVVSLLMMWRSPVFQVKTVQAKGLQRLTVADLNAVLATSGTSVFGLDPQVLKQNLQLAFPELAKISVKIGLPSSIRVVAVEREPVISWTQDGRESWVDAEGVSFPTRGTPTTTLVRVEGYGTLPGITSDTPANPTQYLPPGMPFSTGTAVPTFQISPDLVNAILELSKKMPADTVLVYDSEHGLGWNDPNGWEVFFGPQDQDMEMKLVVYQTLVTRLQSEGIQPAMISVEYLHAPYYRMER